MAILSSRPEYALKRATELMNVGQKQAALQSLHDLIKSKRHKEWSKSYEEIMLKLIDFCVDSKNIQIAKDCLLQYKKICLDVNVASFEKVIKYFIDLSIEKTEQDCNHLEEAPNDSLEDLMLSCVNGEKGKQDRPWLKFLGQTYRTVLDASRNSSEFESLYAMTANQAFQFCKKYNLATEFRRLCYSVNLKERAELLAPQSLQLHLDTKFEQLKIATELEFWQEAFRCIQDIHGLMCLVKKTPKLHLMEVYYAKLIEIFCRSASNLHLAYFWFKLYTLQKSCNKNLSQNDLKMIASVAVLSALSVVPYDQTHGLSQLELQNEKERNLRMANLLGFDLETKETLSRSSLISELVAKGVLSCATEEVRELFDLLEDEFLPLEIATKVQPLLTKISNLGEKLSSAPSVPEIQLIQFVPALQNLTILRSLQQLSQVYQTMTIQNLSQLIPFFDFPMVEKIAADAVKNSFLTMKIDHVKGIVSFGTADPDPLTVLAESVNRARSLIYPDAVKEPRLGELEDVVENEHRRLLARKLITERRKEELEQQLMQKEREEELMARRSQKIIEEAEQKRLAQRRIERLRQEIEEREKLTTKPVMKKRQDMEKKMRKIAKTMDHLERAKREEAAPLIEAAFQQSFVAEKAFYERERQILQEIVKEMVIRRGGAETFYSLRAEREEKVKKVIQERKKEREMKRKKVFFVRREEERLRKLREEEEDERKAKLDEIATKQRRRDEELERKERLRREDLLGKPGQSSNKSFSFRRRA